ncbi:hypothetical protein [Pseudoalteromonas spongiae]|uniref:hypothetical protein n=1 Tax=Pseudoalteromonas spongiae TaxID=298657 RepID=UPI00110BA0A2|nr:hypothetical protein [Pseudoalteromonas spongiae]TMO87581.1 hypothetical protein CWC15_03895 [Pseudoalteromonas spongiae]
MNKLIFVLTIYIFGIAFSSCAYSAEFDYTQICENCSNPERLATRLVPRYFDVPNEEVDDEGGYEYKVLIVDAAKSTYWLYLVESNLGGNVFADQIQPFDSVEERLISDTVNYYNAKLRVYNKLRVHRAPYGMSEPDCSNPANVYNKEICFNFYVKDIKEDILDPEYGYLSDLINRLEFSVQVGTSNLFANIKFKEKANTVFYHMTDGAIIAILLNDSNTGVLGVDLKNTSFNSGKTLHYYMNKDSIREASGKDIEEYLDAQNCTVSGGTLRANYIYTATIQADGSVYINTHTEVEEDEFEIECD